MNIIPVLSIFIEAVIAVLAVIIALRGKPLVAGLAVTFGIYVYYDLARFYAWQVSESMLSIVFLVATLAALISVISLLKESSKK